MILGTQESVAGGLATAFERGARDGADALQVFTKSSRQWAARALDEAAVAAFREARAGYGRALPVAAHASYLINLAAPPGALLERSVEALLDECLRAERLGIDQVIVHPGAALDGDVDAGVARAAAALRRVCAGFGRARVRLLVEVTAGQGTCVGCSLEQLAAILERAAEPRLGVCLDTQHLHAAGIDWTTERGYDDTFARFERLIGLARLEAFHLNDSKRPLGSRVDRHERIGDGTIGLAPFARLVRDPRFATVPGYLETPPLDDGAESYAQGLARLRSLLDPTSDLRKARSKSRR